MEEQAPPGDDLGDEVSMTETLALLYGPDNSRIMNVSTRLVILLLRLPALVVRLNLGGGFDGGRLDTDRLADDAGVKGELVRLIYLLKQAGLGQVAGLWRLSAVSSHYDATAGHNNTIIVWVAGAEESLM
jgi:hypothetical protein